MYEWVYVSDQLREVRAAMENFALRGMIDQCIIGPMLDRVAEDLAIENRQRQKMQRHGRKVDGTE